MLLQSFGSESINRVAAAQQTMILICLYRNLREYVRSYLGSDATLVTWQLQEQTWPPSWCHIRQGDNHYVVIEGSTNVGQFARHAYGAFVRVDALGESSANGAWMGVAEEIRAQLGGQSNGKWHYCGHSYGGAVAGIMAMLHAEERGAAGGVELMTFAAPSFLTTGHDGPYPKPYWRVESLGDYVPNLPPAGVELVGTKWLSPMSWLRRDWVFYPYGNPVYLNYQGADNLDIGDVNDRGPYVTFGMPDNHYMPNYWGRQNQFALRQDPSNTQLRAALNASLPVFTLGEGRNEAERMPEFFVGPNGELERIPPLWSVIPVGGWGAMSIYKVDFVFSGKNKATWRESHYLNADSAYIATEKAGADDLTNKRVAILSKMYTLDTVEAVNIELDRDGLEKTVGKPGVGDSQGKTEATGTALSLGYYDSARRQVWRTMRGFNDQAVGFNPNTGADAIVKDVTDAISAWAISLAQQGFGWVTRKRKTAGAPSTQPNVILSLDGNTFPGITVVTCAAPIVAPQMMASFHNCNRRVFPGLNGLRKIIDISGATCRIPYTIPRGGVIQPGDDAYLRAYERDTFHTYSGLVEFGRVYSKRTKVCCA